MDKSNRDISRQEPTTWKSSLLNCLDRIQTAGDFSWAESYNVFVNPGLEIDDYGQIPLPLLARDAQAVKEACRPAAFGKGDGTVVDDSVRNTWELHPTHFRLGNLPWQAFLDRDIVAPASLRLGLVGAKAKLQKLLLYEPGSFFKPHQDSQKEPGMVGTLVVCLPSEHEGGEVHLSFGREQRRYATSTASKFDMTSLAWFGDVSHEVKELTTGYRLVLTYDIVIPINYSPRSASFFDHQTETLRRILTDWRGTDRRNYKIYYPLDHQYCEVGLSLASIKGRDAAVCRLLHHTAAAAGFSVFVGSMTHHVKRLGEDFETSQEWTVLDKMYTCHGQLIAQDLGVQRQEILGPRAADDADEADSVDEPEYNGNELSPAHFRYYDTVVVLWANSNLDSLLGLDEGGLRVDSLVSKVAQDLTGRQNDQEAVACATRFLKACCESKKHTPTSTLPDIVELSVALNDGALYDAAVKAGYDHAAFQRALARLVEKEYSERADPTSFGAEDWDAWVGEVVTHAKFLTPLRSVLSSFASQLEHAHLQASFRSWKDATLTTQLDTKSELEVGDDVFVLDIMSARHNDVEWLTTSLLPKLCSRGTKPFLRRILDAVFRRKDGRPFASGVVRAIFKHILENSDGAFSLRAADFGASYSPDPGAFVSVVDWGLRLGLTNLICHMLDDSRREFQVAQFSVGAESKVTEFLFDLVERLRQLSSLEAPLTSALKAFFETLLTRGLLRDAPAFPEESFKGWATPARGCGDASCDDCNELDDFLLSEEHREIRLLRSKDQRWHMERRLQCDGVIDFRTEWTEPGLNGGLGALVVKKLQTVFHRDVSRYELQMNTLENLARPLRGEYLEKLLGGGAYRQLVMLDCIRPGADDVGRKRPAEEEVDDAGKRRKVTAK